MSESLMQTFEEESSQLYSLAFLITGNADRSVEAFDRALERDEENSNFGEFMTSWARKLIIVEALGTIAPELRASKQRVLRAGDADALKNVRWKRRPNIDREAFEEAVIAIDALPRCAMLLTIFEGLSTRAASLLLNEGEALTRKAQRMGIVQLTQNLAGDNGSNRYQEPGRNPVPVLSLG
jgi:hypothetical protein